MASTKQGMMVRVMEMMRADRTTVVIVDIAIVIDGVMGGENPNPSRRGWRRRRRRRRRGGRCGGGGSSCGGGCGLGGSFLHLLFEMHLGVSLLFVGTGKFSSADVAGEGLFPGVCANVRGQVIRAGK